MAFFDKKEEVMKMELTPYGRYLLSVGKLRPHYYAFFDDDIVYDSNWAGFYEPQKDIHDRIKEQTRKKPQPSNMSAEERVKKSNNVSRADAQTDVDRTELARQEYSERNYVLPLALGTSDQLYDYAPAWSVNMPNIGIKSNTQQITGSHASVRIPQVELEDILVVAKVEDGGSPSLDFDRCEDPFDDIQGLQPFNDGTFISVQDDYILIDIEELNSEFKNENIEIEFFKSATKFPGLGQAAKQEVWEQLYFKEKVLEIDENGLLVDQEVDSEELDNIREEQQIDNTFVAHYFQLLVDKEIPESVLCLPEEQGRLKVFNKQAINCDAIEEDELTKVQNLYNSDFEDETDICED